MKMTLHSAPAWLVLGWYAVLPAILTAQPARIASRIDPQRTAVARGVANPLAQPRYDRGPADPAFELPYIQLVLKPSPAQQAELDRLLAAQRDPTSPDFHRWLTPEQYADRFGVSQVDLAKISQWLTGAGFTIQQTARARNWIAFRGTAARVEAAFHAAVHRYQVDGESHYALSSDPSLPAAVQPMTAALIGLDDFHLRPQPALSLDANSSVSGIVPADIAAIYDLNPLYRMRLDGSGQKIAIIGLSDITTADVQTFRSIHGLPPATVQLVLVGADPGTNLSGRAEADLDLEWAGAIAPAASLVYVYGINPDSSVLYAIDNKLAPVMSESLGKCEINVSASLASTYELLAKQANSQGMTWVAASGDAGAASCDPQQIATHGLVNSFPATVPEVTAAGGTEFAEGLANYWSSVRDANGASAAGYIPETAWNDDAYGTGLSTTPAAGGGGASKFYPKPGWQNGPGVPPDGRRDLPDIAVASSLAHDHYTGIIAGAPVGVGGTSVASPLFAGVLALLSQYTGSGGLGNINPELYSLAVTSPGVFHDITTGSNIVPCIVASSDCPNGQLGYAAGLGYDLATGLGSVDGYNLVMNWNGLPTEGGLATSLSPNTIDAGAPGFTLTVKGYNFSPSAVVQWNGSPLPSTFVDSSDLTATVDASLIATPATSAVTVSSGIAITGPLYFTALPPAATYSDAHVSQAPLGSQGCAASGALAFFATNMTPHVFVTAPKNVAVTALWIAPDGTPQSAASSGSAPGGDNTCSWFAGPNLSKITSGQSGGWSARVYGNGALLVAIPFTVGCGFSGGPTVTSVTSGSAWGGGYPYFASGSWLEIKGSNLADPSDPRLSAAVNPGQWTAADFTGALAPTSLDGVNVYINGRLAYVWYLSPGQINAQAPDDAAAGNVSVIVSTCKGSSASFTAAKQTLAPGLLAPPNFVLDGKQFLAAQFASDYAYVLDSAAGAALGVNSRPAKPGDVIILYGIGFGPVNPEILPGVTTGQANTLTNPVTVSFGSTHADAAYAGLAPNFVGLYEFYVTVPDGLADGDYQIQVTQNGTPLPQNVYLTVRN